MWKLEGFIEKSECISYIPVSRFLQVLRTVELILSHSLKKGEPKCPLLPPPPPPQSGKPCPFYWKLSCRMAIMTILAKSPVFQLVIKFISPLDNGSPDVVVLIYWMYL